MFAAIFDNPTLTLFTVIALGLLLGRLKVLGLTLGSSGVVFVALGAGHLGYPMPDVASLGLVLFVYCVGITAGPSFFRELTKKGTQIAKMALIVVVSGAAAAWGMAYLLKLPADLTAGLFAGALTSTPALAAALEALPESSHVTVGYGIAYLFGVVGVVLYVQLLPAILRRDIEALGRKAHEEDQAGRRITRVLVEVQNPALNGKTLDEVPLISECNCQVSRIMVGDRLLPTPAGFRLAVGQLVTIIGREYALPPVIDLIGKRSDRTDYVIDTERERRQVVVSSKDVAGRTLGDLRLLNRFGVTVSRVTRHDLQFVPKPSDIIRYGDALTAVGEPSKLERFAEYAGHRSKTFDETDLISLGVGIVLGILVGSVSFELGGERLTLGMAGGPLLVALILGHLGHLGPIVGHLPRASRMLLTEVGLTFFLAGAGAKAGAHMVPVLQQYGLVLFLAGMAVTLAPMLLGTLFASRVLKMDLLAVLGGICGGMTSTPGLGTITGKTDSQQPVISYAAAYPVALIMVTVLARALVSLIA